jgi:phosphatidylglycerophosphatase A
MRTLSILIATVCYVGRIRPAPGTWGSLAAFPLGWLLLEVGGLWLFGLAIALGFGMGWWATAEMTRGTADHDPSQVVIDEVVGQWIALLPVVYGASRMGADIMALWPGLVAAFVLFRLFDISKWGPVGWADRRTDALGVMLDDVVAGVMAAVCVIALAALAHGVLM